MLRYEEMSRHVIIMRWSNWKQPAEKAILPLSVLLSLLCFCEPRARSSQSLSWERLKDWNYIALMVDYFELPERVAEGRRQVLVTRSYSVQENPSRPSTSAAFNFFTARALCDLNGERSGRMLCTTSPGECVGTPNSSQVCLVCSLDIYIDERELPLIQAAVIRVQTVQRSVRNHINPFLNWQETRQKCFI